MRAWVATVCEKCSYIVREREYIGMVRTNGAAVVWRSGVSVISQLTGNTGNCHVAAEFEHGALAVPKFTLAIVCSAKCA